MKPSSLCDARRWHPYDDNEESESYHTDRREDDYDRARWEAEEAQKWAWKEGAIPLDVEDEDYDDEFDKDGYRYKRDED